MCIVALKHFPNTGWVGVKNRDRNYKPLIYIKQSIRKNIERIYLWDDITKYTEGMNEYGVCILSAAVATKSDEKEGAKSRDDSDTTFYSSDGKRIRTALFEKTPEKAIECLEKSQLPGTTIVFNAGVAYLIEAGFKSSGRDEEEYFFKCRHIDKSETAVRTNHGIWLSWLGYQPSDEDEEQQMSRDSSESRLEQVRKDILTIKEPHKMLDCLSNTDKENPQMNPLRMDERKNSLRTTGQLMLVPSELTLYYRPIWCEILFNFGKLDSTKTKTYFQILSARGVISPDIDGEKIVEKVIKK